LNLKQATTALLALVVIIAPAHAQNPTTITLDGKNYTVTELPGRTMHMVQLAGPEGTAMVMVNNQNQITMYANPPGGGDYKSLIDNVWKAYVDQKNGTAAKAPGAAPAPQPPAASSTNDPNAALREQAAAMAAQAQQRAGAVTNPPMLVVKEFPAGGGAIVTKGSRTITLTADGADATIIDQSVTGKSRTEKASYEGNGTDGDYKVDSGKVAKGMGQALVFSGNAHMENRIQTTKDRWKITDGNGHTLTSSGGFNASMESREPQKSIGDDVLRDVYAATQAAKDEAAKRKAAGQPAQFDPDSTPRGQHAYKALATYVGKLAQ